jgi:hypothetical protein
MALVGFVAWLCLTGMAFAQRMQMSPQGILYVTGGVGNDERAAMEAMVDQYNLKLEFAMRGGNYLGDVRVMLRGPVSLDVISDGPLFLAKLPPGTYSVTAIADGQTRAQNVVVGESRQKSVTLFW